MYIELQFHTKKETTMDNILTVTNNDTPYLSVFATILERIILVLNTVKIHEHFRRAFSVLLFH